MAELSTKPYLLRALYEWCSDSGLTPYVAVIVDERTVVPQAFVRNGGIVLNISMSATNKLVMGNDLIEFQARFNGVAHELSIPVENVSAIYARETGHGMAFEVPNAATAGVPVPRAGDPASGHDVGGSSQQQVSDERNDDAGRSDRVTDIAPAGAAPRKPAARGGESRRRGGRSNIRLAGTPPQDPVDADGAAAQEAPSESPVPAVTSPDDPRPSPDGGGAAGPGAARRRGGRATLTRVK